MTSLISALRAINQPKTVAEPTTDRPTTPGGTIPPLNLRISLVVVVCLFVVHEVL
jgi:hypothetical protein